MPDANAPEVDEAASCLAHGLSHLIDLYGFEAGLRKAELVILDLLEQGEGPGVTQAPRRESEAKARTGRTAPIRTDGRRTSVSAGR